MPTDGVGWPCGRLHRETAGPGPIPHRTACVRALSLFPDSDLKSGGDKVQWPFVEQCVHLTVIKERGAESARGPLAGGGRQGSLRLFAGRTGPSQHSATPLFHTRPICDQQGRLITLGTLGNDGIDRSFAVNEPGEISNYCGIGVSSHVVISYIISAVRRGYAYSSPTDPDPKIEFFSLLNSLVHCYRTESSLANLLSCCWASLPT